MPAVLVGAWTVACRYCRVAAGRPCRNRRGYLTATHRERVQDWLAAEAAERP